MAINLALTLTLDGRDAFWNSGNTGTKLDITHLQFGTRNRLPTGEESLLSLPKQSVKIQNGNKIGPDQVRIMATMPGIENYNVTEIGLWSGEPGLVGSILVAYTSVRTGYIAQMVNGIDLVFTYDMVIATTDIDKINIVKDTDQSSTFSLLAAHETDRNAHPFYVTTDTAQTISGAKTFTNKAIFSGGLTGELTGNAATATQLKTPRTIGGVSFNGTANINLPGVNIAGNQNTSGNAATASKLAAAVLVGGIAFDGSAAINLPGVNIAGNQNTSGNAATATKLQTARTINGVSFDGSANITIADNTKLPLAGGTITGSLNVSDTITVTNVGEQVGAFKKLIQASTTTDGGFIAVGNDGVDKGYVEIGTTDDADAEIYASQRTSANAVIRRAKLLDDAGNTSFPGTVTAPTFNGALNGNAATATKLQTARSINGVGFDGTANITIADDTKLPLTGGTLTGGLTAPNLTATGSIKATTCGVTGMGNYSPTGQGAYLSWNRNDGGGRTDFINNRGGGAGGFDWWNGNESSYTQVMSLDQNGVLNAIGGFSGNAATATKLQTARTINGVAFDGSANITIADSTKLPLAGGTITGALTVNGLITAGDGIKTNRIVSTSAVAFSDGWLAKNIHTGGVLASDFYADSTKVPTNGIYSKGKIHTATSVEVGSSVDGAKDTDYIRAIIHPPTHTGGDWEHTVRDDATYAYYKLKYGTSGHLQLRSDGTLSASGGFDGNASTATKLATARTISLIGDGAGSASFDGSANTSINLTLNDVNNSAGTYGANNLEIPTFTLNKKGLLTSAGNRAFPYAGVGQYGAAILYDGLDSHSTSHSATANIVRHLNAVKVDINKSFNDAFGTDVDSYITPGNLRGFTSCADFPVGSRMIVDVPALPDMPNLGSAAVYFETKRTYTHPGKLQIAYGYNNGRTATRSAGTGGAYSDWVYTVDTSSISRYRQDLDATRIYSPNLSKTIAITDINVQVPDLMVFGRVFANNFASDSPYSFLTTVGQQQVVMTGGLLASDNYADQGKVHGLGIYAKGVIESAAGFKGKLLAKDLRTLKPSQAEKGGISSYFVTEWGLNNDYVGGNYGDFLSLNTYHDASAGNQNGLFFDKTGKRIVHYQSDFDAANWGYGKTLAYAEDVLSTNGGTMNAPINFNLSQADGAFHKLIEGSTSTDGGYIAVGNHGSDRGYLELGTVDDPDAAIYARKRNTPNTILEEAVILGPDGNTSFPHSVFIHGAVGGHGTCGLVKGNADNAEYTGCNIDITSWFGVGIKASNSGERTVVFNARNGDIHNRGSLNSEWFVQANKGIGISNIEGVGHGLSLYNGAMDGMPTYGIAFAKTYHQGGHGYVDGDWATYFTMEGAYNRGWIFKSHTYGNVASISSTGVITAPTFNGNATSADRLSANPSINGVTFNGTAHIEVPTLGYGQSWQNVREFRASGVNYTNTTGKPIYVVVNIWDGTTFVDNIQLRVKGTDTEGDWSFIVPNGSTYRCTGAIRSWTELR